MTAEEIKEEQERVYAEMRREADEVAKKLNMSPDGHGVGGFLSPMKMREMYRDPDPDVVPHGIESIDFDSSYEDLLSQVDQLDMDLLSPEEKYKLVVALDLKARGGDINLI